MAHGPESPWGAVRTSCCTIGLLHNRLDIGTRYRSRVVGFGDRARRYSEPIHERCWILDHAHFWWLAPWGSPVQGMLVQDLTRKRQVTGLASSYRTRKRQVTVYKWNRKADCSLKIP